MASLATQSFPRIRLGLRAGKVALPGLLTRSMRHNLIQRTVSSRNTFNFRNTHSNTKINVNSKYSTKGKVCDGIVWLNPVNTVRTFSTVLRQHCVKQCNNINCGRSQSLVFKRCVSKGPKEADSQDRKTTVIYICAIGVFMVGASYAGVPLYRIFCQATGLGGQAVQGHDDTKVEKMAPVKDRVISIRFNADVASSMRWNFKPQQTEVKVLPGETALAFYTARNPTDKPIIGISTYNVIPFEAGPYFNKIQCFCFEEQRLNPHEQVDMPVFFFIDPEFAEDPKCAAIETITLSYTFFEAKEGLELPYPGYAGTMYAKSAS